jgi:hypothetical protein
MESVRKIASPEAKARMAADIVAAVDAADESAMTSIEQDGQMVAIDCYVDPEELLIRLRMVAPIQIEIKTTEQQQNLIRMALDQERRAIIEKVLEAAPPINAELSMGPGGTPVEDPAMAAYVEAWHSMWAIVNERLTS